MTWHLGNEGHQLNEKRIRRLMRLMGLMPTYQKPSTSKAAKGHKTAYIEPGSHWENGYCESFNARFRDELLNGEVYAR